MVRVQWRGAPPTWETVATWLVYEDTGELSPDEPDYRDDLSLDDGDEVLGRALTHPHCAGRRGPPPPQSAVQRLQPQVGLEAAGVQRLETHYADRQDQASHRDLHDPEALVVAGRGQRRDRLRSCGAADHQARAGRASGIFDGRGPDGRGPEGRGPDGRGPEDAGPGRTRS